MVGQIPACPQQHTLSTIHYAMDIHHPPNHKSTYYAIQIPSRRMETWKPHLCKLEDARLAIYEDEEI